MKAAAHFDQEYLARHIRKEDLFWTTYMGVADDPHALEKAEQEYKSYVSDPSHLAAVRESLKALPPSAAGTAEETVLRGWEQFFLANAIESAEARSLQKGLIEAESTLFNKRAGLKLTYKDASGNEVAGSTVVMASNIAASDNETVRKTSHEALLKLEQWVLANGYLELVKKRNEFARAQGFENYFAYRVFKNERLTTAELFNILSEFESLTRETAFNHLKKLAAEKGPGVLEGHNIKFAAAGDGEKKMDPYFPFQKSLETWSLSFARMGIGYRGALLHLDLFDRKGKYENGFMHSPQPCYLVNDRWQPARINFTSNATPNLVGSGRKGLVTLFHEGGHAAHMANVTMPSPCFSMEYPPTSMAYAETQSMFCDSVTRDADWLALYARDPQGNAAPDELIQLLVTLDHPFMAFQERMLLLVPTFESRLYALPESELTPEKVTALARRCEQEVLGISSSPRPLLSIPHLLGSESACSYQGYLLANMAVYQTREHFFRKYGAIVDNPAIGTDLTTYYWNPGNSLSHSETIRGLTGQGLSGKALAEHCNLSTDALWKLSRKRMDDARTRARSMPRATSINLEAEIRIVHGKELIADNRESMQKLWADFETWVTAHYPRS